jgi:hypothetical protein
MDLFEQNVLITSEDELIKLLGIHDKNIKIIKTYYNVNILMRNGFYGLFYGIFLVGGDFYSILPVIIQYAYHFFTSCFSYAFTIS